MLRRSHAAVKSLVVLAVLAILAGTGASLPLSAAAPTARPEDVGLSSERLRRITELMQRHIDAGSFSGAVTLVARRGRVAHFEAQGLMDREAKKPMTRDAMFRIMSMTKPIVGVSILMMMEEGKVRLTDPISKFIPEFKALKVAVPQGGARAGGPGAAAAEAPFYTVPAEREITVRDLLTHTSGLMSGGQFSGREGSKIALKGKESLADYLPRLGGVPLDFQPGTRWSYSAQAGFDVLVRVVELASGQPFDRFVKQRVFDPLGMKDTFFYPADGNPRMATLYRKTEKGLERQNNPNFMNGAYFSGGGGLFTTAEDYLQFALMLMNNGQLNGTRLLSPRLVELMASPFIRADLPGRAAGEGFGLSVRVVTDPTARNTFLSTGSFGWSGAFGTHFWVDQKEQLVAILMTQTANNEARTDFENAVMQSIVAAPLPPLAPQTF